MLTALSEGLDSALTGLAGDLWLSVGLIGLVALGEAVLVVGLFVPSTPVLLLAGGLVADGRLPFLPVYAAAVSGAVIGDAVSYWLGFALKDRIMELWPLRRYPQHVARGEAFFERHGGKSVFIGRFVPGIKTLIPGIAGLAGMDWRRFTIVNVVSALAWAAAHIVPGMLLVSWLESMGLDPETTIVVSGAAIVAGAVLVHAARPAISAMWCRLTPSARRHGPADMP